MYVIAAPAPLCTDPAETAAGASVACQILEAPDSATERLVPSVPGIPAGASGDVEIRLTYRQLTELITDAVKSLRE